MKLVFIIIALALIGGGYYYYATVNTPETSPSTTPPTSLTPTPTPVPSEAEDVDEAADVEDTEPADTTEEEPEPAVDSETEPTPPAPTPAPVEPEPESHVFNVNGTNFAFDVTEMRVKEGDTVTVNFESTEGFHDWVVDEFNAVTDQVSAGNSSSVTFVADKPGSYEYYCSVGSHRALGMVGTLIVE